MPLTWLLAFCLTVTQTSKPAVDPYRALLDSFGQPPRTTLIREYVPEEGNGLGRTYATDLDIKTAIVVITDFYRKQVRAQGWEELQLHAAIEAYSKQGQIFTIIRKNATDDGLAPRAKLLKEGKIPPGSRFFFDIEVTKK